MPWRWEEEWDAWPTASSVPMSKHRSTLQESDLPTSRLRLHRHPRRRSRWVSQMKRRYRIMQKMADHYALTALGALTSFAAYIFFGGSPS